MHLGKHDPGRRRLRRRYCLFQHRKGRDSALWHIPHRRDPVPFRRPRQYPGCVPNRRPPAWRHRRPFRRQRQPGLLYRGHPGGSQRRAKLYRLFAHPGVLENGALSRPALLPDHHLRRPGRHHPLYPGRQRAHGGFPRLYRPPHHSGEHPGPGQGLWRGPPIQRRGHRHLPFRDPPHPAGGLPKRPIRRLGRHVFRDGAKIPGGKARAFRLL